MNLLKSYKSSIILTASKFLLSFLFIFFSFNLNADNQASKEDPYRGTRYAKAFNVSEIFLKYQDVLRYEGTIKNLPEKIKIPIIQEDNSLNNKILSKENYTLKRQQMINEIIANLDKSKRDAVLRPLYRTIMVVLFQCLIILLFRKILPRNSIAAGFSLASLCTTIGWIGPDAVGSLHTYYSPTNDPYARWEYQFAEKMPYIPSTLWDRTIDTFGAARMGDFQYADATRFFDIAFNLPVMYRYAYQPPVKLDEVTRKANAVNNFTVKFFENYENSRDSSIKLQAVIRKYLKKLATNDEGFICVHLKGPGGVGKTHYMKALAKKISEVIEQEMPTEEITIRSDESSELEGNKDDPGQILTAISPIAKKGKPYGILIFDEAAWLNGKLKDTAKKIFEPDIGSFKAQYLGGLDFSLKGFLVIFLSNDAIKDEALNSRMIHIDFPSLKKENLKNLALNTLDQHLEGTGLDETKVRESKEIKAVIDKAHTMRDININFPAAVEEILHDKNRKTS